MELKQCKSPYWQTPKRTFNQPRVELKHRLSIQNVEGKRTFNQPRVELKLDHVRNYANRAGAFNQPRVELKLPCGYNRDKTEETF